MGYYRHRRWGSRFAVVKIFRLFDNSNFKVHCKCWKELR